jgi:hypothetical protein
MAVTKKRPPDVLERGICDGLPLIDPPVYLFQEIHPVFAICISSEMLASFLLAPVSVRSLALFSSKSARLGPGRCHWLNFRKDLLLHELYRLDPPQAGVQTGSRTAYRRCA